MIEIIKEKEIWDNLVKKCDFADFYHTYDYHHAAKATGDEPVLIQYTENNKTIVLPLLFRNIEYSLYKDATSVYGYPGPITKNITSDFDYKVFQKELYQLFREHNIVSVFFFNPTIMGKIIQRQVFNNTCIFAFTAFWSILHHLH